MEKILLIAAILLISATARSNAETIKTGDASAKSEVRTEVQGDANVYTKIEVEANGEKKTLESREPGTHTLEVKNSPNSTAAAATSAEVESAVPAIQKIFQAISELFKRIFSVFGG